MELDEVSGMATEGTGPDGLGEVLRSLRERAGLSQSALARQAGLNPSFVNRLESGQRGADRAVVDALTRALALDPVDADRLLVAALDLEPEQAARLLAGSRLPPELLRLGVADPTLRLVAGLLGDPNLDEADRAEFRRVVEAIGRRWRGEGPR